MESVSITEIVRGLTSDSMRSQRMALLQLLANKIAETEGPITKEERSAVFTIACLKVYGETEGALIDLGLTILTNSTINEENAVAFLEFLKKSEKYNSYFQSFMNTFLSHNPQLEFDGTLIQDWSTIDPWQNMSSIICNLCQIETGRALMLRQSTEYMIRLLPQVRSKNLVRRRGAIGCIRTCLFDKDIHWWIVVDCKILDHLIIPLIVATPFTEMEKNGMSPLIWMQAELPDKKAECDLEVMKMLLECILLLCQRRGVREELRKQKVYCVVKNLHLEMEDEGICNVIAEIVDFLMGDEDVNTPIDKYGESTANTIIDTVAVVHK